jgi:hypothetical protein
MDRKFIIQKALSDTDKTIGWDVMEVVGDELIWCDRFELKRWAKEALANYLAGRRMIPN